MSVYVRTVEELIVLLSSLPRNLIICDPTSDNDGVFVSCYEEDNYVMIRGTRNDS